MINRRHFLKNTILSSTGVFILPVLSFAKTPSAQNPANDELERGFLNPPATAKPLAYWMWMNGHITRKGITLDLEAMKKIGLAGAFIYNTNINIPKGPVAYGSKQWKSFIIHAMSEAKRLGLELSLHNSPGFSSTGGAKVTPEMSMQQVVWAETIVQGNDTINIRLAQPATKLAYYKDAFVIAYPSLPAEQITMRESLIRATANGVGVDKAVLFDNDYKTGIDLQPSGGEAAILGLEFSEPFEARAITVIRPAEFSQAAFDAAYDHPLSLRLQSSNDGLRYEDVCIVTMPRLRYIDAPGVQSFPAVKAKFYRVTATQPVRIASMELHGGERLEGWPGKMNFTEPDNTVHGQQVEQQHVVDPASVINITNKMEADGRLVWKPPPTASHWTVLRIGHTCTGTATVASPDGATGLEIDKFSAKAVDHYFRLYLNDLLRNLKPFIPQTFKAIFIDSWEVGRQNWSANFPAGFMEQMRYDITPWMPALTGRIVQSISNTEKFLWDLRRTQARMVAQEYYGGFQKHCAAVGLQLHVQPNGDGMSDSLEAGGYADEALAEFWTRNVPGTLNLCKEAVSIAHGYGKKLIAAEAYTGMPHTSRWSEYPYALKAQGDYIYSTGVNRFVFHVIVHQPYTTGLPGMTMGPYGSHFDRNTTWMAFAKPWVDCLSRTQYLLQQGLPVADVCYFKGEDAASGIPDVNYVNPPVPKTLAGDVIGPDVLLKRITVKNSKIVLPDGMQYSVMILAPLQTLSIAVLIRLKELVQAGMALVVTARPTDTAGLENPAKAKSAVNELWGNLDGMQVTGRPYGKGKIYWNEPFTDLLKDCDVGPDFRFTSENGDAAIHYTHRRLNDADIYFISNHLRRNERIVCSFRTCNKIPEIWNPRSAEMTRAAVYSIAEGQTNLPLALEPSGSLFIIFRKPVNGGAFNAVLHNGVEIISAQPYPAATQNRYQHLTDNFTISLWIKPDTPAEHPKGVLLFPPEGEVVYGTGHTACGLSAGQNGVRAYERDSGPNRGARSMIWTRGVIEGWTHLALRYAEGKPSLFIDGVLAGEGKPSGKTIHPGLQTPPTDEAFSAYFEGDATAPELLAEALTNEAIATAFKKGLPPPEVPSIINIFKNSRGKLIASIWQNGFYQIRNSDETKMTEVTGCKTVPLQGEWTVKFPAHSGAPSSIKMKELFSLRKHPHFDVRHFSGTAVYETTFLFDVKNLSEEQRVLLHLGRVECIADVALNEKKMGILWKDPFSVDFTKALRQGINKLQVAVTNLWQNRMIGDAYLPTENEYDENGFVKEFPTWYVTDKPKPGGRKTFAAWNNFKRTDPLLEAGLLGPVQLLIGYEKVLD